LPPRDDLPPCDDLPSCDDLPPRDDLPSCDDLPPHDDLPSCDDLPPCDDPQSCEYGPKTLDEYICSMTKMIKEKFSSINKVGRESHLYGEHVKQDRVVVDVNTLLPLFENGCQHHSCSGNSKVTTSKTEAGVLCIYWNCTNGHQGRWTSSRLLCQKEGQNIYTNSILLATAVIITGNNYDKMLMFCKFMNLGFISKATFSRLQRNYVIPAITSLWDEMKTDVWTLLAKETIILCGDGRNDSPGHCAKYCTYILMEQFLNVIVDVENADKRETRGISTNMEVFCLKNLLERIAGKFNITEIVTDASTTVIALVRRMKGKFDCFTCNPIDKLFREFVVKGITRTDESESQNKSSTFQAHL
jgi:hypothetical protein